MTNLSHASAHDVDRHRRSELVGNSLALVGTIVYFFEWIAIVIIPDVPTSKLGADQAAVVDTYKQHPQRIAFAAGWWAVVLLGRVAFASGLRNALRVSPRQLPLADLALGAMIVSVAIELASSALMASAAWLARSGADPSGIGAIDAAADVLFTLVFVLFGVSVFTGALAMLLSGLFRHWVPWIGIVGGGLVVASGLVASATLGTTGTLHGLGNPIAVPLMWVWMIATSIVLFRARPRGVAGEFAEPPAG